MSAELLVPATRPFTKIEGDVMEGAAEAH